MSRPRFSTAAALPSTSVPNATGVHIRQIGFGLVDRASSQLGGKGIGCAELARPTIGFGCARKAVVVGKIKIAPVHITHAAQRVEQRAIGGAKPTAAAHAGDHVAKAAAINQHLQIHRGPNVVHTPTQGQAVIDFPRHRN